MRMRKSNQSTNLPIIINGCSAGPGKYKTLAVQAKEKHQISLFPPFSFEFEERMGMGKGNGNAEFWPILFEKVYSIVPIHIIAF